MKLNHLKIAIGIICAFLAVVLVFRKSSRGDSSGDWKFSAGPTQISGYERSSKAGFGKGVQEANSRKGAVFPQETRPLELPVLPVDEKSLLKSVDEAAWASGTSRRDYTDDDILTQGGVLVVAEKPAKQAGNLAVGPRSIKSEDWKGAANLLVNALRSGDRFEVNQDELMNFLRGKDLLGWPESYRNWIGDELMTALRQDMPDKAFESLRSIEADTTATAAMRDYSVQHISHLVTSGVIGKEGADYIWQTLKKNDPQTLGTALISLHRLSEQVPDLVSAKEVQVAADGLKENRDERTRITAESILRAEP